MSGVEEFHGHIEIDHIMIDSDIFLVFYFLFFILKEILFRILFMESWIVKIFFVFYRLSWLVMSRCFLSNCVLSPWIIFNCIK